MRSSRREDVMRDVVMRDSELNVSVGELAGERKVRETEP